MTISDISKNTVFLLGAGASVDAGCLTSREMLRDLKVRINGLSDTGLKTVYDEIYSFLYATLKYKYSLEKQDELVERVINIEDFFMLLRQLIEKEAIVPDPFVGSWNNKILKWEFYDPDIFSKFRDFIVENLRQYWTKNNSEKSKEMLLPIKELATNTGVENLEFFTLNYDLVFESLFNPGEDLETGFSSKVWRANFDNYSNPSPLHDVSVQPIKLKYYKLHGSLDWWYDEEDEEVRSVEASKNSDPFIVFGTEDKVISVDPFLYLLGKFRERLSTSNLYVIIGYSFSDQHINNLLLQQLKANTNRKIMVSDPRFKGHDEAESKKELLQFIQDIQRKKASGDFKNIVKISEERLIIIPLSAKDFYKEYLFDNAKKLQEYHESMAKEEEVF